MVKYKYTILKNKDEITATVINQCYGVLVTRIDNQSVFSQRFYENGKNVSPSFMI